MKKSKKLTISRQDLGRLLLDLGKLIFGSIFLGGVLRGEVPQKVLVIGGFIAASLSCLIGLLVVPKEKELEANK